MQRSSGNPAEARAASVPDESLDPKNKTQVEAQRALKSFQTEALSPPKSEASEKSVIKANESGLRFDNPFQHLSVAGLAIRELQSLKGLVDSEQVTITEAKGNKRQVSVGERKGELHKLAQIEFSRGIHAADRIDQKKVESNLFEFNDRMKKTTLPAVKQELQIKLTELEALKHSPSAVRFAFAMYLGENDQLAGAKKLVDEAGQLDSEALHDPEFQQFKHLVEQAWNSNQARLVGKDDLVLPMLSLQAAQEQRQKHLDPSAEQYFKKAIEESEITDPKIIQTELNNLKELGQKHANEPNVFKEIGDRELAWSNVAHAPALTRIAYADFLLDRGRNDEARKMLLQAGQLDPVLANNNKEFQKMLERTEKRPESFDNPYEHFQKFETALNNKNISLARQELQQAVTASGKIDRNLMQNNRHVLLEQMKAEKDPEKLKQLQSLSQIYDAFDHAPAFSRIVLGRFELAAKNYNTAHTLFESAEIIDRDFTNRPELEINRLLQASVEPSTWKKVLNFTKSAMKELACDATAILAGAGTVVLTGWSGPAAIAAGAGAGALAYTGMKKLFGEQLHWYTPLWGALDGASGGMGALARQSLVRVGGQIVTKEMAEAAVVKTGGSLATMEGLEGMEMADTAQKVAAAGLKSMGKDIGFWTRASSSLPFLESGSADYRAALGAYRTLHYTNLAVHGGINFGTAATVSSIYRGGQEVDNYFEGKNKDVAVLGKDYAGKVLRDGFKGMTMGAYSDGWADGIVVSAVTNSAGEAMKRPADAQQYFGNLSKDIGADTAFGSISWILGASTRLGSRLAPSLPANFKSVWVPATPILSDAFAARRYLKDTLEPGLQDLQRLPTKEELQDRYDLAPGTNSFPAR